MVVTDGVVMVNEIHIGDEFYHCVLVFPTGVPVNLPGNNVIMDCLLTDRQFFWENPSKVAALLPNVEGKTW